MRAGEGGGAKKKNSCADGVNKHKDELQAGACSEEKWGGQYKYPAAEGCLFVHTTVKISYYSLEDCTDISSDDVMHLNEQDGTWLLHRLYLGRLAQMAASPGEHKIIGTQRAADDLTDWITAITITQPDPTAWHGEKQAFTSLRERNKLIAQRDSFFMIGTELQEYCRQLIVKHEDNMLKLLNSEQKLAVLNHQDKKGRGPLHCAFSYDSGAGLALLDFLGQECNAEEQRKEQRNVLFQRDEKGQIFLHYIMENCSLETLQHCCGVLGDDLTRDCCGVLGDDLMRDALIAADSNNVTAYAAAIQGKDAVDKIVLANSLLTPGFQNHLAEQTNVVQLAYATMKPEVILAVVQGLGNYAYPAFNTGRGDNALQAAIKSGNAAVAVAIVRGLSSPEQVKTVVSIVNKDGDNALQAAIKSGNAAVVEEIVNGLENPEQVQDVVQKNGGDALMQAAALPNHDIFQLLYAALRDKHHVVLNAGPFTRKLPTPLHVLCKCVTDQMKTDYIKTLADERLYEMQRTLPKLQLTERQKQDFGITKRTVFRDVFEYLVKRRSKKDDADYQARLGHFISFLNAENVALIAAGNQFKSQHVFSGLSGNKYDGLYTRLHNNCVKLKSEAIEALKQSFISYLETVSPSATSAGAGVSEQLDVAALKAAGGGGGAAAAGGGGGGVAAEKAAAAAGGGGAQAAHAGGGAETAKHSSSLFSFDNFTSMFGGPTADYEAQVAQSILTGIADQLPQHQAVHSGAAALPSAPPPPQPQQQQEALVAAPVAAKEGQQVPMALQVRGPGGGGS